MGIQLSKRTIQQATHSSVVTNKTGLVYVLEQK